MKPKEKSNNLNNVAVYFNNEYIGEARTWVFKRGINKQMALLEITGDFQYG